MNPATILYLPPPHAYKSATAILENLAKYPAKREMIIFSEHNYELPGQIVLKISPEVVKGRTKFAINNLAWLTGLRIAKERGITHMICLEADCRVGEGWDENIFDEYFNLGRPCIAAGTLAVYNPCASGLKAAKRWENLVARNVRKNVPIATYGWMQGDQKGPSCVFPNGALSVQDVMWMEKYFPLNDTVKLAVELPPFDMAIGLKIWETFQEESYDVLGHLDCIYSGYGDALTTEEERLNMLRSGAVVGIHQVKSGEQP